MTWKKVSPKKILDHPRMKVYEEIAELPNGKQTDYITIDRSDAAAIIAINNNGEVLLQKEYSYPPNERLLQFPDSVIENGESPEEGAERELAEEAGLKGRLEMIGWFYPDNRRSNARFYVFTAVDLVSTSGIKDEEESFEDAWHSVEKVNELIRTNKLRNYSALAAWSLFMNREL